MSKKPRPERSYSVPIDKVRAGTRLKADDAPIGALCFDAARQQFLRALREMLADRSLTEAARAAEVLTTFKAIAQMVELSDG